ncbi:PREDICTED: disintegrin and metalloproteinase domain-containing protein 10-like [Nicrophorus vespilloides]|uniref:Disintegrin and metalloproteinase domain-containing protein 10-like n=1 Tax=Nicrophorus vespilloides TaxID=110193 RepID=A0ABM1MKS4_NICVS|nr:PREDICTED: disintegrin and metalloproteinase domain-containing protein 10-like [Nicrophorus vespilloides]
MTRPDTSTEIYDAGISTGRLVLKFVEGYVEDHLNSSFVDGFLDVDTFYGIVYLENNLYHIEKMNKFPELRKAKDGESLIYKRKFVGLGSFYDFIRNKKKVLSNKGNICTLHIFMDESFTKKICNSDIKYCVSLTVSSVKRVNSIFRSTDFNSDGYPDNIGFRIKRISSNNTKNVPKYNDKMINSKMYLESFALHPDLKDVCLGIAFTAQSFKNNVVGVSYAALPYNFYGGGICSRYYNALVISYFHGNREIVRQDLNDIALAHELGHSFGSFHDINQEYYLMSAKSTGVLKPTSFTFSKRSRDNMYSE